MDLRLSTQRCKGFPSLKDAWADTTTPHGRLMLTVLGGPQKRDEFAAIHSITSSARAVKATGKVMPSAVALFKLIAK